MDDTRDKYDELLHLADEARLPDAELRKKARELFPLFTDIAVYDEIVGSYEIEVFMQARSMGLSVEDAAYSAEVTHTTMKHVLEGQGVSLAKFTAVIRAELFARAQMITKMLSVVERAESNTSVNAAIALLEKIAPERYGKAAGLVAGANNPEGKEVVLNFSLYEE